MLHTALGVAHRMYGILIADDMGLLLTLLKLELEPRGFTVWLAQDGNDAIDIYRQHQTEIDVVLLDVQMPSRDGPQTLAVLRALDPNLVACFMTGYAGNYSREELLAQGVLHIFDKPFRAADLAQVLTSLVNTSTPLHTADSPTLVDDWQIAPTTESAPCLLQNTPTLAFTPSKPLSSR